VYSKKNPEPHYNNQPAIQVSNLWAGFVDACKIDGETYIGREIGARKATDGHVCLRVVNFTAQLLPQTWQINKS